MEWMAKEETFLLKGIVTKINPNDKFTVKTEFNGKPHEITATLSGNIRKFRIRIAVGDSVTVCITPYDIKQGRITFRNKENEKVQ